MTRCLFVPSAAILILTTSCTNASREAAVVATPQAAVDALLDADRAFAASSARTDLITGITAMFTADVITPVPGGKFSVNATEAAAALRAAAGNAESRAEWAPIRGGISADGRHGFTFGYMTVRRGDGTIVPMKYLSYWVKRPEGWRVAVYRRRQRAEGEVSTALLAPSLPARMTEPRNDAALLDRLKTSLGDAERSFSREAQSIGLNAAFAKFGSADAINMGGPTEKTFVFGAAAIGRAVSDGEPATGSSVSWAPDIGVMVASSGDLGVTIGTIRPNAPPAAGAQPTSFPFFTVWHRGRPGDPWRYIAE